MKAIHRLWFGVVVLLTFFLSEKSLADDVISAGFQFSSSPFQFKPVEVGENAVFDCSTNGDNVNTSLYFQRPTSYPAHWKEITKDTPRVSIKGDVYTLKDVGIVESGYYKCMATDGRGQTIEWPQGYGLLITYRIIAPEVSVYPNHLVHLTEGQSQNFTCESGSTITEVKWYRTFIKNRLDLTKPFPASKTVTIRDTTKNVVKNILMIKNARESDSGLFKCISNFRGKQRVRFAALRVFAKVPPKILSHSPSLKVVSPHNAKIECIIEGHPLPNIKWYHGNKEITIPGCKLNRVLRCQGPAHSMSIIPFVKNEKYHATLTIAKTVYPHDHGVYRCEASNDQGTAKADIFVSVQGKPVLAKTSSMTIYGRKVAPPYIISCSHAVQGNPPATTITWEVQPFWTDRKPDPKFWIPLTEGHVLRPSQDRKTSTVEVPPYMLRAFYRCTATNAVGKDTHVITYKRNF